MLKKVLLASVFALGLGLITKPAAADNIPVQNASFESYIGPVTGCGSLCFYNSGPIPGWTISGTGGSFHPNSTYFNLPLPDGSVVAYSNGGTISQTLTGTSELANTFYTLSVWVGDRKGIPNTPFSIAVDLGATSLCSQSGFTNDLGSGAFMDITCSFSTNSFVTPGDLSIVLTSGGTQTAFDNVTLRTPEPGSLALLGFGSIFALVLIVYSKRGISSAARLL
jgi:hypothetical protein